MGWRVFVFVVVALAAVVGWRVIDTRIDREVMVQSHQYVEGMESRAAIFEANLVEIGAQLRNDPTNQALINQRATVRAQLKAVSR